MNYVGSKVAVPGQSLVFSVLVTDADQDPLTFSATGLPSGATFTATAVYGVAEFRWTPAAGQTGTYPVTLKVADDGHGNPARILSDEESLSIVVRATNAAPALRPIGTREVAEGTVLNIALSATDSDGDPVTFAALGLPSGATLNAQTGAFRWTPNYVQSGQYVVRFEASDGNAVDREDVTIVVRQTNQPPQITPLPPQLAMEGLPLAFTVAGGDLDRETIQFFVVGTLPRGAAFNSNTGEFSWTPDFDQAGTHAIRFGVSDTGGLTDTFDAQVQVLNVNRAPTIDAMAGRVLLVGQPFQMTVPGIDADGNPLTFSAVGLPPGASLNPATGVLTWTPTGAQAGEHHVLVRVTDGDGTDRQDLRLVVAHQAPAPAVHIEFTPSFPLGPGQRVTVQAIASGIGDIASLQMTIDGQPVTLDSFGCAFYVPAAPGHHAVVARATDSNGLVGTATADLKVRDLSDFDAPVVSLLAPPDGAVVSSPQAVVATVADANLDRFVLEVARLGSDAWQTLATATTTVTNQALAQIDPNRLANGAYTLRLTATDIGGRTTTA